VYAVRFIVQTAELAWHSVSYSNTEVLISVLHLLDIVMVSHLIVMIMIGGYVLFIGDFSKPASDVDHPEPSRLPQLAWLGHIDPGALKVKMSMSMLGVSSIHLLEAFVRADNAKFRPPHQVDCSSLGDCGLDSCRCLGQPLRLSAGPARALTTEVASVN
jgi:uncharacterized protein (TIGR00645 family)